MPESVDRLVRGKEHRVEDAERNAGKGEGVGEAHGFGVHDGQAEEQEAEYGHSDPGDGEAEAKIAEQEERRGSQFDRGIAPGDGLAAAAAAATEKNPAEDGDVVAGADHRAATGAVRTRVDDGLVARQARDADVEEAAEGEAEDGGEDGDDRDQWVGSGTTVEYERLNTKKREGRL